ncbi:PEGA domain-containing protein, partial [Candidatus Curtissbacteria bacterium]|nr:PEGA domain-containing protein [Candidatus Curtissbacteria bacterium]
MAKKSLLIFLGIVVALLLSYLIVQFAKGYRFDIKDKTLSKTGILAISSSPQGAAVYINDKLTTATNNTLSGVTPGKYKVKITKDGYSTWEKEVEVKEELVTPIEAVLFPSVTDLRPLTFNGVINPKLSFDGQKIAFGVSGNGKDGIWVLDLVDRPIIFSREPRQIVKDTNFKFSGSELEWSPDSKTLLVKVTAKADFYFTLNPDQLNIIPNQIFSVQNLKNSWQEEERSENQDKLARLKLKDSEIATNSAKLIFSPDETKVISLQEDKKILYDSKPGEIPNIPPKTFDLPAAKSYIWHPNSKNIILVEEKKISIIAVDLTNKMDIYSGDFDPNVVFPWPNGSKLLIATSFNPDKKPNLYALN